MQVDLPIDTNEPADIESFIHNHAQGIEDAVREAAARHTAVKFYVTVDMELRRTTEIGDQITTSSFRTPACTDAYFNPADIADNISGQLDHFNERGSSW